VRFLSVQGFWSSRVLPIPASMASRVEAEWATSSGRTRAEFYAAFSPCSFILPSPRYAGGAGDARLHGGVRLTIRFAT
jgi:hypothetical protein